MAELPSTHDLLHAYDARRPRTMQVEIGMSALGGCRRQTGYRLNGYSPDPDWERNNIQAILGTSIHEAAAKGAAIMLPEARAEDIEVRFGGLVGHPDIYYQGIVRDIKTKGYSLQLEQIRLKGPARGERYQVHCYAAGLILSGFPVDTIQLDYIARDSGEELLFEEPFSIEIVREAMAWLKSVREADPEILDRDFRPDSGRCRSCEFFTRCWEAPRGTDDRSVLYRDDPDAAAWARKLAAAREAKRAAEDAIADAAGALEQLGTTVSRPGDKQLVEVEGLDRLIQIAMQRGRSSPNMERIAMDYKDAGARPPMKIGKPSIVVTLVKRPQPRKGKRA